MVSSAVSQPLGREGGGRGCPPATPLPARDRRLARRVDWTADEAVTRLFATQYRPLVRLATLLLHDSGLAEE